MKNILITGGNGYIGSEVIKLIEERQNVRILKLSQSVFTNISVLQKQIKQLNQNVDYLIHLGWGDLDDFESDNHWQHFEKSKNFLEFLGPIVKERIFISGTCFEYDQPNGAISEGSQLKGTSTYASAKIELYKYLVDQTFYRKCVWGRIFFPYGGNPTRNSLYNQILKAMENDSKQFLLHHGYLERDFIQVEFLSKMINSLIFETDFYGAVNLGSGEPRSLLEMAKKWVSDHSGKLELLDLGRSTDEPLSFYADTSRIEQVLKGAI